jgi:pimeloyl-ACP methyl ester carboxylesterase
VATAARHPEAVRRLVLVAPAGLAPRALSAAAVLGAGAELAVQARRALGYRFVDRASARWAMFASTIADPGALDPDDARLMLDASGHGRRISDGVRQALEADLRDDLASAPMPVGLIWGASDRVVPYAGIDALRRLRPDAAVETLARTGHIPQLEDPQGFAAAVERVLAAL